jgi:hypothetical protein
MGLDLDEVGVEPLRHLLQRSVRGLCQLGQLSAVVLETYGDGFARVKSTLGFEQSSFQALENLSVAESYLPVLSVLFDNAGQEGFGLLLEKSQSQL